MSKELKHDAKKASSNAEDKKHLDNSAKEKKPINKKLFIIIGCVLAVAIAGAVVAFLMINNANKDLNLPTDKKIMSDLSAQKSITSVIIGKRNMTFKVTSVEKSDENVSEDKHTYTFSASVKRSNKTYAINPVTYKVKYVRKGSAFDLKSAEADKNAKIVLTPVSGADKNNALKRIKRTYKKAKFKKQDTDLKKGKDKLTFTVDDMEYEGEAYVLYKFSSSLGWKFDKIDDSKVSFKKGVTHLENGLYTNSAVKNVLFLGIDDNTFNGRSDVMMLISIDTNTGKIKQTSFMRDNWFNIPGYGEDKLNAAYAYGGASLTLKTIQSTFGIKIDNYVATNFSTFKNIINTLGGVDVDITSDEAGYINWQINKNGQASAVGTISESGGVTHLNGQQALWLCRDRGNEYFSGDDFMRTGRQRKVIQALAKTYKNLTPAKLLSILLELKSNVRTDMTRKDIAWFTERSPKFFTYKFQERCVPTDGEWEAGESAGGAWIIALHDFEGLKKEIQQDIYEDLK